MTAVILGLCALAAAATVSAIVLVAVFDWAEASRGERLALGSIGAGLVWAAPGRFAAGGVSFGDFLLLLGVLALVLRTYGRQLLDHADEVDGQLDGRLRLLRVLAGRAQAAPSKPR